MKIYFPHNKKFVKKRMAALEAKAPAMKKKGSSGTAIARKIKTQDAIKRMVLFKFFHIFPGKNGAITNFVSLASM